MDDFVHGTERELQLQSAQKEISCNNHVCNTRCLSSHQEVNGSIRALHNVREYMSFCCGIGGLERIRGKPWFVGELGVGSSLEQQTNMLISRNVCC